MWRRRNQLAATVASMVLLTTACGGIDEPSDEAAQTPDTMVVVDEAAEAPEAADVAPDETPDALALRESDAGTDEVAEPTATTAAPGVLPPADVLDEGLAAFANCLNDNGADVAPFTLQDMISKAAGMPLLETRADMFAFFLDEDGADPVFVGAVEECNPLIDAIPGLSAFVPAA